MDPKKTYCVQKKSALDELNGVVDLDSSLHIEVSLFRPAEPKTRIVDLGALESLREIRGDLHIQIPNVENIDGLNGVESVRGTVTVVACHGVQTVSFPRLRECKSLSIQYCDKLTGIRVPLLKTLDNFTVGACPTLVEIDLAGLENITRDLYFEENIALRNFVGLSSLCKVGRDFSIIGNWGLESLRGLENLRRIDGELNIQENDILFDLDAISEIEHVGYFSCSLPEEDIPLALHKFLDE